MKPVNKFSITVGLCVLIAALSGCEKPEGPAERAGKNVDEATQKLGQKIERAGEKLQDAGKEEKK